MTKMQINGSETNTTRLFHLDLPREAVERFTTQAGTGEWPLKYGLGASHLRGAFVDVVDLADLGEMPLTRYLTEAHGVQASDLRPHAAQIDGLRGHVIILPSPAFDGQSQDLTIATPLRWIGTFAEDKPTPRGARLRSSSAKGQTGGGAPLNAPDNQGWLLKLVLAALAVIFLAVLVLFIW